MLKSSPIGDVIIDLIEIDSTNNYAMRLINEGMAEHGLVIRTDFQTQGKGQHGHIWMSEESKNLLFTLILDTSSMAIDYQFMLNAMTAVTIANFLMIEFQIPDVSIKWPNDIYAGKKKISGILIENHLRGSNWTNAVIGIGININQQQFPDALSASSVYNETGKSHKVNQVLKKFLPSFNQNFMGFLTDPDQFLKTYNSLLLRQGMDITYTKNHELYRGRLIGALPNGELQVETEGKLRKFKHKEIEIIFF